MKKKNEECLITYIRSLIIRSMLSIIIFLILATLSKTSYIYKNTIISNIYEKNISFPKIKQLYYKYLGGITPLDKVVENDLTVFNENLAYTSISSYYDGAKLTVEKNYLVPVITEGMIIYIGEKENYGNVIIIEGIDGIDIWYGNMETTSSKLYDYVNKNTYLGTTKDDTLYLIYQKDGLFLDYLDYLS